MDQKIKLSLRYKFLLIMVALLSGAILSYLILAISLFQDDKKGYVFDSNASLAHLLANETKSTLQSTNKTLKVLAATYFQKSANESEKVQNLQKVFLGDDNLAHVAIFSATAKDSKEASLVELSNREYLEPYSLQENYYDQVKKQNPTNFLALQNKSMIIQNASMQKGAPLLALSIPFSSQQNQYIDLIVLAYIKQDSLMKIFTYSQIYNTFLLDSTGKALVHPDLAIMLGQKSFLDNPTIREIITGKTPNGAREYQNKNDKSFILAYSKLEGWDLTVISEIEKDKAFLAARKLVEKSILFALLIVFVAIIVSVLFTKSLTKSLKTLYEATVNIARGDFSVRVNVKSQDEVGSLAGSFNMMAGRITDLMKQTAEKAKLERELDTAKMVQSTFFPEKPIQVGPMTVVGLYQPASQCGGDWWGHFPTANGKQYIFIADAMGHGVPAALVTAMAYSTFMSMAELVKADSLHSHSPSKLLELFNKILYDALRGKISMTFFAAIVDFENASMTYANGGHNFPVLVPPAPADDRAGAAAKKQLDVISTVSLQLKGSPLGLDRNAIFDEKTIALKPGDKLFMFTDGLIEGRARSPEGPQWGRKNLIKQLMQHAAYNCEEMKTLVMNDAFQFFSGNPPDDDITVVVMEMSKSWQPQNKSADQTQISTNLNIPTLRVV